MSVSLNKDELLAVLVSIDINRVSDSQQKLSLGRAVIKMRAKMIRLDKMHKSPALKRMRR